MDAEWSCFPNLCAVSHIGARKNNEDNFVVEKLEDGYYLGIADGMGGREAGEVASAIAIETAKETVLSEYKPGMDTESLKSLLAKSHERANEAVLREAVGERKGMGTTLITAVVRGNEIVIANTGDSRAQLIRNGEVVAMTRDHNRLRRLLDEGKVLTKEEAMIASSKLTHAVGGSGKRFAVDTYRWEAMPGDALLMSTDGLHDYVEPEEVLRIISSTKDPRQAVEALLEAALPVTKDNVTIILYRW